MSSVLIQGVLRVMPRYGLGEPSGSLPVCLLASRQERRQSEREELTDQRARNTCTLRFYSIAGAIHNESSSKLPRGG